MKNRKLHILPLLLVLCILFSGCSFLSADRSPVASNETGSIENGEFTVCFIDVGQADSILLLCDGHSMLIDGGNVDDADTVISFLKKYGVSTLDYVVCTHAHEDHCGGLSGVLSAFKTDRFYAPVTECDSRCFEYVLDAAAEQGLSVTLPQVSSSISLGNVRLEFLGPQETYNNTNDTSIVIRAIYGDTSFLFTGDAGTNAEHDIIDAGCDLSATVLKAGHHGSDSSSSYVFLREIMPSYVVISVGEGNQYGHPSDDALSRFRDVGAQVFRTDLQGSIICTSDGSSVSFSAEKNEDAQTNPTLSDGSGQYAANVESGEKDEETAAPVDAGYIGNVNSQKFHLPTCSNLPKEENRVYFTSRDEAVASGYEPCGSCKP